MSTKKRLAQEIIAAHAELAALVGASEAALAALRARVRAGPSAQLRHIEAAHAATITRINADLDRAREGAVSTMRSAAQGAGLAAAPWSYGGWTAFKASGDPTPPRWLRLGELCHPVATRLPPMPALAAFAGRGHVFVSFDHGLLGAGAAMLQAAAWRAAALTRPGAYELILVDPLDQGHNVASLLQLPPEVRGLKVFCQDDEIEQVLASLASDLEDVVQNRLVNEYADIDAYNAAHPSTTAPYRILVFTGFPDGFTAKAADLLATVARSGRRAGCLVLGGLLRGHAIPHGFDLAGMLRTGTVIRLLGQASAEWNDPELKEWTLVPDAAPPPALVGRLAGVVRAAWPTSDATTIPFLDHAVRRARWWQGDSADGLAATIGLDERGRPHQVVIGTGLAQHALVGGATSTGKSNLLHLLILQLCTTYSPAELELYLVDFKEGVEFQDYATHALPHARAIVVEAEREFGLSVLDHLVAEMERRSQTFKQASLSAGVNISDLAQYRRQSGRPMPRVLLLIDEYVVLFSDDDRLAMRAAERLAALVNRGRSFGIHVLLSAQRPASSFLSMTGIKAQMQVRIAFKCRPDDSTLILGEGNEHAARLGIQPGLACVTTNPEDRDATTRLRVIRVTPEERGLYLRGIAAFARTRGHRRASPAIVFDRDARVEWATSPTVAERLTAAGLEPLAGPRLALGQPIRIAPEIAIDLVRRTGENVLILGTDEDRALSLVGAVALGTAVSLPPDRRRCILVGVMDRARPGGDALATVAAGLPMTTVARQEAVDAVAEVAAEVARRGRELPVQSPQTIVVVVAGLHRWLEAKGPTSYQASPTGEQLVALLQQGPDVGVHLVVWCDRLATLGAVTGTGMGHDVLAYFRHRVALHMGADESTSYLGVPAAGSLGSERALYRDGEWQELEVEKFKPYNLPEADVVAALLARLDARWGGG